MWLLTSRSVAQYLLNRSISNRLLLSSRQIGLGQFNVIEVSKITRNNCFWVEIEGLYYFLKQPKTFADNATSTIKNEAQFYKFVSFLKTDIFKKIGCFLDYDEEKNVLIFKAGMNFKNIAINEMLDSKFIPTLIKTISDIRNCFLGSAPSKYLRYYRPVLLDKIERQKLLLRMAQFPDKSIRDLERKIRNIENALDSIDWRAEETVIHRDIKYENLLLNKTDSAYDLKLIDWELAAIGDSDWDIAVFCYPILKSSNRANRLHHDFGWDELRALKIIKAAIHEYSNDAPEKTKKILKLCAIQILEYYVFGVLNGRFNKDTAKTEKIRVDMFFALLERNDNGFFTNYLNKKIQRYAEG